MEPLNFPFVLLCMKIATDKIDGNRISLFCEFYFRNRMPATMAISCEKKIDVISTEHHSPSRKYIVFSYFIIIIMENHHFSEHQTVEAVRTAEHSAVLCCECGEYEWAHCRSSMSSMFFILSFTFLALSLSPHLVQTHTTHALPLPSSDPVCVFPIRHPLVCIRLYCCHCCCFNCCFYVAVSIFHSLTFPFIHADFCITLWIQLSPHHCSRCQNTPLPPYPRQRHINVRK